MPLIRKWGRIREFLFPRQWVTQPDAQTHNKTALANNPALSRNMHCKHSWLIAEKLLNPVNNQIILPQYKQRWQRQTHTGEEGPCNLLRFHGAPNSCWGTPDSTSFLFFLNPPLKEEEKHTSADRRQLGMSWGWTNGRRAKKKRCEKRQMGAVLVTGEDVGKTVVTVGTGQIWRKRGEDKWIKGEKTRKRAGGMLFNTKTRVIMSRFWMEG